MSGSRVRRAFRVAPFLLPPLALGYLVFRPITGCYFFADDWFNLQSIVNESLPRYLFFPFAGHILIVRNGLFHLFYHAFGTDAAAWFRVVLLTHLANVALLFAVVRRLCGSRLACFGATLWGTAPMHEGALGWYSVYGQVVAATLLLVLLLDVVRAAALTRPVPAGRTLVWCGLLLVASMSFGIAIGIALTFPLVVSVLLPGNRLTRRARAVLWALPPVVLAAYFGLIRWYIATYGGSTEETMGMLTGFLLDWRNVLLMFGNLLAAGTGGLLVGPVAPLATFPTTTLLAAAGAYAAALVLALATATPEGRRRLLALSGLVLSGYGIIAVGRGPVYATWVHRIGGEEIRYHYLVPTFLTVLLCVALDTAGARVRLPRLKTTVLAVALGAQVVMWGRSSWAINQHNDSRVVAQQTVDRIARAIVTTPPGEPVVIENQPFAPALVQNYFAGTAAVYAIFFPEGGRPVYFVEKDPAARARVTPGTRLARLLVAPDAIPAPGIAGQPPDDGSARR